MMNQTCEFNRKESIYTKFLCVFLALTPILDPYILFSIGSIDVHIVDLVMLFNIFVYFVKYKRIAIHFELVIFIIIISLINCIASVTALGAQGNFLTSLRVIFFWVLYVISFSCMVDSVDVDDYKKTTCVIAVISCILLFIQFVCLSIGLDVWNGRLPFLQIGKYDGWSRMVDVTGSIRAHSFFQERSYQAIYLLPLIAYSFAKKLKWLSVVLVLCTFLTTSTLGIGGVCIVLMFYLLFQTEGETRMQKLCKIIPLVLAACAIIVFAYYVSTDFKVIVDYIIRRLTHINSDLEASRMGSTKIRLIGNIEIFSKYPFLNKLFGVGVNQYSIIYSDDILYDYSNTMVNFMLNTGFVGTLAFVVVMIKWMLNTKGYHKVYPVLFLYLMMIDQAVFNWYFFYLLTWVVISLRENEKQPIKYFCK